MKYNKINEYVYFSEKHDDFFENFKDLFSKIKNISTLVNSTSFKQDIYKLLISVGFIEFEDYITLLYNTFGLTLDSIYYQVFAYNPHYFDSIIDINMKLKLAKYRYPNLNDNDCYTEILKKEWEDRTKATDSEIASVPWIKDFLRAILYDMTEYAKETNSDVQLEYIGEGGYFQVYRLGNEVLKLGSKKHAVDSDYSRNYMVATLDKCFSDSHAIEVSLFARTQQFSKSEIYKMYIEERKIGKCWVDCRSENLGILLCDNKARYENLTSLGYKILGIKKETKNPKHKGEIVIIDRDFSYFVNDISVNDVIMKNGNDSEIVTYEDSYQKTKK